MDDIRRDSVLYIRDTPTEVDIFEACRTGSLPLLEKIFQRQDTVIQIHEKDKNGKSPLHYCCYDDKLELLKMIVSNGGRLDMETSNGKSCLQIACQESASSVVEYLLQTCPDLTKSVKGSYLSTHYCARGGSVSVFKHLLEAGMKPASVINKGPTCLHIACKYGNLDMVKFLVTFEEIVKMKDRYGWNAIHYTVSGGHMNVLGFLLSKDFDLQILTDRKYSALHISCDFNHNSLCEIISRDCPSLLHQNTKDGYSPLHFAAKRGNLKLLELFLTKGITHDVKTKCGDSILHVCIQHHRTDMARFIMQKFPDLIFSENNAGIFPIHTVIEYCNEELFDQLLCDRAVVLLRDKNNETVLHKAILFGQMDMAQYLIKKFPELIKMSDVNDKHPIDVAITGNKSVLVEMLLPFYSEHTRDENFVKLLKTYREHISKPDILHKSYDNLMVVFQREMFELTTFASSLKNMDSEFRSILPDQIRHFILSCPLPENYNLLHVSILNNDTLMCKVISTLVPDLLSKRDSRDEAPIHTAARLGYVDHLQILVKAGASPSLELRHGLTILHIAALHNNLAFVEYVISNYPDLVNIAEQTKGYTPLHISAESGELAIFKMLVCDIADLSKCTKNNKAVLEIACEKDNVEIVKYILENCRPDLCKFQRNKCEQQSCDYLTTSVFQNISGFLPNLRTSVDFSDMIGIAKENKSTSLLVYIQEQTAQSSNLTIHILVNLIVLLFIINLLFICVLA